MVKTHKRQQGELIGERFRIVREVRSGGFGSIYEAVQMPLGRKIALKVLNHLGDETQHKRFLREAWATSLIDHPNIVTIHDYGIHEGQPFIAMALLEGHDLEQEIAKGPMERLRALRLMGGCLDGLARVHRQGIVHKDLKPSNLFIAHPGTDEELLKMVDFGISHIDMDGASTQAVASQPDWLAGERLTRYCDIIGTPRYMAPEYIESKRVCPALDVYQMGLILAEMLTGKPAVEAESMFQIIYLVCEGKLDLPSALRDSPEGAVIERATARQPEDRYEDAATFGAALREALPDVPWGQNPSAWARLAEQRRALASQLRQIEEAREHLEIERESLQGLIASAASRPARQPQAPAPRFPTQTIPAGAFTMGSPPEEEGRYDDESAHRVALTHPLLSAATPLTQAVWQEVVGSNPSTFLNPTHPVEGVSWYDAIHFCNALSGLEGHEPCYRLEGERGAPGVDLRVDRVDLIGLEARGWRLPTEAEWEYIARSGAGAARYGLLDEIAWYGINSYGSTRPVAQLAPSPWGIFDMLGNVYEWVWDRWGPYPTGDGVDPTGPAQGTPRVYRGGNWRSLSSACRAAYRRKAEPDKRAYNLGFRVVRTL